MKLSFTRFRAVILSVSGTLAFNTRHVSPRALVNVVEDIENIGTQVSTINMLAENFPANGLTGFLKMHNAAETWSSLLGTLQNDLNSLPPPLSTTDAGTILTLYDELTPMILGYLDLIATKRGQVNALPINNIAALVKFDLNMTEVASTAVDNTLLSIAAADPNLTTLQESLTNDLQAVSAAFQKAIAAFS